MSRYTVGVAHCPKTYARLAMSAAPVAEFRKAGIAVGIGTDGVVSNSTLNGFEAMRLTAMLQKHQTGDAAVFPVAQALYTATRGGAAVLGMADRLGAVEPGFLADLLIVDLSGPHHQPVHNALANLVYNVEPADVRTVIVNGEVVIQEREHRTIDVAAVSAAIREAMPRLSRRDGGSIQDYNP
jgi:5-methylthioadenosine/S-adenosylhomocysteine deaminase